MLSCGSPFNSPRKWKSGFAIKFKLDLRVLKITTTANLVDLHPPPASVGSIPVEALAIQPRLRELKHYLSNGVGRPGTIAILGPAGVGKTILLKALHNKFLNSKKHDFDVVIFAAVPRKSSCQRLQSVIARALGLPWRDNESQENMAVRISMSLKKKRFLLLLDEVRKPLNLGEIGIPSPDSQNRSKVLFTTRSESVCGSMDAIKVFKASLLDQTASWQLFQINAGETSSHPDIIEVAKKIVVACEGLPLGLITIGRAMTSVMTREAWIWSLQTLKDLKSELSLEAKKGKDFSSLMSCLYFSYKNLSTEQLKQCLLYCSLYPENHSIEKEELISYWIGEGLLNEHDNIDRARSEGNELIARFKALGLLQDGDNPDSEVMMHDTMRSLALKIVKKNEYFVKAGEDVTQMLVVRGCNDVATTEKISLMNNNIASLDQLPAFPCLSSLILKRNIPLERIRHDLLLFQPPSLLKILDLSHTSIREIPREIGNLVLLRHLNLSFTEIKALPIEICSLVNLVQLLLEGTSSLARIPGDVICNLSKLLVLNLYASYGEWEISRDHESSGTGIDSVVSIEELMCLEKLGDLGITICNTTVLESFLKSFQRLAKSTRRLFVKECEDFKSLHLSKLSFENLQQVTISYCNGLEKLIIGGSVEDDSTEDDSITEEEKEDMESNREDGPLMHLEVLRLRALYKMDIIWRGVVNDSAQLPMLRELDISYCHKLINVSWVLQLSLLETIKLDTCLNIEQVVQVKAAGKSLPRLRTVTLRNLRQLKHIFTEPVSFPLLELVTVSRCPQLRSLPRITEARATPVFIRGEIEWWNALEWKAGSKQKQSLFWYFQAANELY